ncbi:MAG: PAS domain S-box protein [Candidatus Hodarchaeota archaeon]
MEFDIEGEILPSNIIETTKNNLQNLFNSMEDLIFVLDFESRILHVNSIVLKRLNYSKEDLIGKSALKVHPPDQREEAAMIIKEMIEGKRETCPIPLLTKDGDLIPVETKVTRGKWGNRNVLFGISRDITERKKAEEALKESEKKYRDAFGQAKLYKEIFAHDINNILQNVQSSLELSSLYIKNPEKFSIVKELYSIIKEQVARGSKLINNVRKLSTIQESEFKLKPIKVNSILKESVKFLYQSFQTRKINFKYSYNKVDYIAHANELLLDVFENILLNAVRHNSNVNVNIEIKISKEEIEGIRYLKVEFIDNGDGIEDVRKKHIFQRGSKEKSSNGGMGLGLSLVKKTIDRYNGKIWVEDRIKGDYRKGSNFIVLIPEAI